ncbi:MAG: zinc ribbon domain-containing protein [Nitrospira sp.]|nr:zinc ribbon domain-containing protein [Nitrospira sp.]
MPIYEYECLDCGKHCEMIQKFSDEPLDTCPDCGGHMHKLISHTSFILKGTGWYVTDYASSERKKAKESEATPSTKVDTKSEPKKETKAGASVGT